MANEKNIKTRVQHKHDTEANWLKAEGFIPKIGELIVYDVDDNFSYPRIKIGDGITNIINLPFANSQIDITELNLISVEDIDAICNSAT